LIQLLTDMEEPSRVASNTEKSQAPLMFPRIDMDEPIRMKERTEIVEPIVTKFNTEVALPHLV
jgi:hypothetical protein